MHDLQTFLNHIQNDKDLLVPYFHIQSYTELNNHTSEYLQVVSG
jgi:hypothetical protein